MFRLFLSHSSPTDFAKERLNEVARSLEERHPGQLKVLFDKEQIMSGDDWRSRISLMMHSCQAAAVLLDKTAVDSPWVLYESLYLSERNAFESSFRYIPVFIGDREEIKSALKNHESVRKADSLSWNFVPLTQIQAGTCGDAASITEHISHCLLDKIHNPDNSLAELIAEEIQIELVKFIGSTSLRNIAGLLEDSSSYYTGNDAHLAALALVRLMLSGRKLRPIREVLDDSRSLPKPEDEDRISLALAPLAMPEGAGTLVARMPGNGQNSCNSSIRISDAHQLVISLYLRRGHLPRGAPKKIMLTNAHGTFAGIRAEMRRFAKQHANIPPNTELSQQIVDKIAGRYRYLVLPGPVQIDLLQQLHREYPDMSVIQYHSHDTNGVKGVLEIPGVLTIEEEEAMLIDYIDVLYPLDS